MDSQGRDLFAQLGKLVETETASSFPSESAYNGHLLQVNRGLCSTEEGLPQIKPCSKLLWSRRLIPLGLEREILLQHAVTYLGSGI